MQEKLFQPAHSRGASHAQISFIKKIQHVNGNLGTWPVASLLPNLSDDVADLGLYFCARVDLAAIYLPDTFGKENTNI